MVYIIPYSPIKEMATRLSVSKDDLNSFYQGSVHELKARVKQSPYFDGVLDLSDFDDTMRKSSTCNIPEPTPKGAKVIAERIVAWVKDNPLDPV